MMNRFFVKAGTDLRIKILGGTDAALEAAIVGQGFTISEDGSEYYDGFDHNERTGTGTRVLNADGTYTVNGDSYNHCDRVVDGHRYDNRTWSKIKPTELADREAKRIALAKTEAERLGGLNGARSTDMPINNATSLDSNRSADSLTDNGTGLRTGRANGVDSNRSVNSSVDNSTGLHGNRAHGADSNHSADSSFDNGTGVRSDRSSGLRK